MIFDNLKSKKHTSVFKQFNFNSTKANEYELIHTITIPANHILFINSIIGFSNAVPMGLRICANENVSNCYENSEQGNSYVNMLSCSQIIHANNNSKTIYIFGKWNAASWNWVEINGYYEPM